MRFFTMKKLIEIVTKFDKQALQDVWKLVKENLSSICKGIAKTLTEEEPAEQSKNLPNSTKPKAKAAIKPNKRIFADILQTLQGCTEWVEFVQEVQAELKQKHTEAEQNHNEKLEDLETLQADMQDELEEKQMEAELNQQKRQAELSTWEPKLRMELHQKITEKLEETGEKRLHRMGRVCAGSTSRAGTKAHRSRTKPQRKITEKLEETGENMWAESYSKKAIWNVFIKETTHIFNNNQAPLTKLLKDFNYMYRNFVVIWATRIYIVDVSLQKDQDFKRDIEQIRNEVQKIKNRKDIETVSGKIMQIYNQYAEQYPEELSQWEFLIDLDLVSIKGIEYGFDDLIDPIMQPFHEKTQEAEIAQKNEHAEIETFERNMATEITQKKAGIELKQKKLERLLRNCERDIRTRLERQIRQNAHKAEDAPAKIESLHIEIEASLDKLNFREQLLD